MTNGYLKLQTPTGYRRKSSSDLNQEIEQICLKKKTTEFASAPACSSHQDSGQVTCEPPVVKSRLSLLKNKEGHNINTGSMVPAKTNAKTPMPRQRTLKVWEWNDYVPIPYIAESNPMNDNLNGGNESVESDLGPFQIICFPKQLEPNIFNFAAPV